VPEEAELDRAKGVVLKIMEGSRSWSARSKPPLRLLRAQGQEAVLRILRRTVPPLRG